MRKALTLAWGLAGLAVLAVPACRRTPAPADAVDAVGEIVVRPAPLLLRAGEAAQLAAQANDSTGRPIGGAELSFTSATPELVRVSANGAVVALGPVGDGTILVASGEARREVPVTVTAGVPVTARAVGGTDQSGEAETVLAEPVHLQVTDAFGNPVPRAAVTFETALGGAVEPATAVTDMTGAARAIWTLGSVAGAQALRASSGDAAVTFEATALPGRMATIEQVGAIARRVVAGDTVTVRLRTADRHGNGVAGVVVAFSVEQGAGAVVPARVETAEGGVASARWTTGTKAGLNVLRALAIEVRDTTIHIELRTHGGAPASARIVRGAGQSARVGSAVPVAPAVLVTDANGNPVSAARVRFVVSGGAVDPAETVTDADGLASVTRWVLASAGANTLTVVVDGVADSLRITARGRAP